MKRILHDASYSQEILRITADTLILVDAEGVCRDVSIHTDLCFMQEKYLLGKNVFDILPEHTREKVYPEFKRVLEENISITKNFKLPFAHKTYYFKCIMHPYKGMVLCQYRDITERCNIKLQMQKTNEKFRDIQHMAKIATWRYSLKDDTIYYQLSMNETERDKFVAIPRKEYMAQIFELDRDMFANWLNNCLQTDIETPIAYRALFNNEWIHVRILAYTKIEKGEGDIELEGYAQDITEIRRKEKNLDTLTHAIDNAAEEIFAAKEDGTLIFVNKKFRELHKVPQGVPLSELKIHTLPYGAMTEERWMSIYGKMENNTYKSFIVLNPIKENKELLGLEVITYTVLDENQEKNVWIFGRDISGQIKYETEIKRTNQILDVTMKNLPASIVVKDVLNNFSYIYRNRDVEYNILNDYKNIIGKTDFDMHPYDVAAEKRLVDIEVFQQKKYLHDTLEKVTEDGKTLILDRRKVLIESNDFSPMILNIEWDITELELTKRELIAAKEKAETSDQFKSSFLANMSHEIRTPLNAIVGFSRIIADCDNFEERREYYSIVEANNERLLGLINEILDLSKIESGVVEFSYSTVSLHDLCKEVYDAHTFRCPENVKLVFEESASDLHIKSDKNRIFQVLSNLIGNAFKFVTKGSVSYGYELQGEQIVFHVTDTGLGIAKEKLDSIFDRFVKLNTFAQGTGLGLSICRTIIEKLGGSISVTSELGKGTTFTFTLPYNELHDLNKSADMHESMQNNTNSPFHYNADQKKTETTILVAEDIDNNFDLLKAILGKEYRIIRAKDGKEAIELYRRNKPDLILMDIKMPNMNGLDATKKIRESSIHIPIIALSAYAYVSDREAAKEAGCNDFITKPISQNILNNTIHKWLK